ncbi:MAG: hypothetical protein GSR85_10080 [Desulfurococcales archaeon]|nr:hypothetical protein [Desulfurococcales archaeon]
MKPFRSYDTIIVYVHEMDDVWSRAHIYQMRLLSSGDVRIFKKAVEDFRRKLKTYDDYIRIRDRYVDEAIEALEELILIKHAERLKKRLKLLESVSGLRRGEAGSEALHEEDWG